MKDQIILRVVAKFLIPFILLFGLYVQLHGKVSPGGGFQAGVILAAAYILYALVFGTERSLRVISLNVMRALAALGVLAYAGIGCLSLFLGGRFLNYSVLATHAPDGQLLGIMIVEIAIGLTVSSVMMALYITFATHRPEEKGDRP